MAGRWKEKKLSLCYKGFKGFVLVIKALSPWLAFKLGRVMGHLFYYLSGKDRRIAQKNLETCPLLQRKRNLKQIVKDSFKHQGLSLVEFIKAPQFTKEELLSMVEIVGREYLDAAFARGKGVIYICSHLGNWELMGIILSLSGYPICPLVQPQKGHAFDTFINRHRVRFGIRPVPVGFTLREVLKALHNNELVSFMMDQNPGQGGIEVDFLGRKARLARGAAVAAYKSEAPVVAGSIFRVGPWRHKIKISPVPTTRTENRDEDIKVNTRRFSAFLTEQILEAPGQWLWSYKRKWEDKLGCNPGKFSHLRERAED